MKPSAAAGVVLAHPVGNQFFRHLAAALRDAGKLAALYTCIDWRKGGWGERVLPPQLTRQLARREFSQSLRVPVGQRPWRELARLAAPRLGMGRLTRHETGVLSVDAVCRDFDGWVARRLSRQTAGQTIYAYEDAAETSFRAAAALGWRRAYDLPIAYWEVGHALLATEAERWPEWEPTLEATRNSPVKLARKTRELELADVVICPSRFVAESLPAAARASKQVVVAPFGSPGIPAGTSGVGLRRASPRLRVLFAGAMTQRKGLADLFAAIRLLDRSDVELVIMGSPLVDLDFYRRSGPAFSYEKPRPHAEVLALMATCDVFCLPSIVEGRALVVQEALSAGLPAIVTANTGADDAIEEGRNGFVVPIRSPEAIAAKLAWLADHRAALPEMAAAARVAAERYTWSGYGATILQALGLKRTET